MVHRLALNPLSHTSQGPYSYLLNLLHLLHLLPRLLPESPTPIKAIFFELVSWLTTPKSVLEQLQEKDPRVLHSSYSALTLTSPILSWMGAPSCSPRTTLCPARVLIQVTTTSCLLFVVCLFCLFPSLHQRSYGYRAHTCIPVPRLSSSVLKAQ